MKKLGIFLIALCLLLAGCQPETEDPKITENTTQNQSLPAETGGNIPVSFAAQYIRTDGYHEGAVYPRVQIINDLQQLQTYYEENRELYGLERRQAVYSDSTIGFLDACDSYDARYFETGQLILVLLEEGSGSIRHEVRSIERLESGELGISIDRLEPECGTCDMAQWHIIVELNKADGVEKQEEVKVLLDNGRYPPPKVILQRPPNGALITPQGEADLRLGGYSWYYEQDAQLVATIADQAGRPLTNLDAVEISPVSSVTDSQGPLVKLSWFDDPDSVKCFCWQEDDLEKEIPVAVDQLSFYAFPGAYIYELTATWEDDGSGWYGTANYYVLIHAG